MDTVSESFVSALFITAAEYQGGDGIEGYSGLAIHTIRNACCGHCACFVSINNNSRGGIRCPYDIIMDALNR